jgi:hypothetical protein
VNAHYRFNAHEIGIRSITCTLLAAEGDRSLVELLSHEMTARHLQFEVVNGRFLGYDDTTGLHRFIMKPGTPETKIVVPAQPQGKATPFLAAVRDQQRRNVQLQDSPNRGDQFQWLSENLNPTAAHQQDGPGAYLVRFKVLPQEQTLRVSLREDAP